MADIVEIAFDFVALVAVAVFALLSLTLGRTLAGSALRRGFRLAGIGGIVHLSGNIFEVLGDLGLVEFGAPLVFAFVEAVTMVLLAFAVQSFFPVWFKSSGRGDNKHPFLP